MPMAAICTRLSSNRQRETYTPAGRKAGVFERATTFDLKAPEIWILEHDGCSRTMLVRPEPERVRDVTAVGDIEVMLVQGPIG